MDWTTTESTALTRIGYDPATQQLHICFKDGRMYEYSNVSRQVHAAFVRAESKGQFFSTAIRDRFPFRCCAREQIPA